MSVSLNFTLETWHIVIMSVMSYLSTGYTMCRIQNWLGYDPRQDISLITGKVMYSCSGPPYIVTLLAWPVFGAIFGLIALERLIAKTITPKKDK